MTDQLSAQISEYYHQLEAEWRESQEDRMITMNEALSLAQFLYDEDITIFGEDYEKLAIANLEVGNG